MALGRHEALLKDVLVRGFVYMSLLAYKSPDLRFHELLNVGLSTVLDLVLKAFLNDVLHLPKVLDLLYRRVLETDLL